MTTTPAYPEIRAIVDGHDLHFIFAGSARLEAILNLIDSARQSVRMCFYIFGSDHVAARVADALVEARNRGVSVMLIVDGFGTGPLPNPLFATMIEAGVEFARFVPRFGRRFLLRNHQKMILTDGHAAMIGGFNIDASYFPDNGVADGWHDLALHIEGPAAQRLEAYFDALMIWVRASKPGLLPLVSLLAKHSETEGALRLLFGGPSRRLNGITRNLRIAIAAAQRVDMIQAYFAPNWGFLRKLGRVAKRGEFNLITAAISDNRTTISAARHCYRRLLISGTKIYEYLPQKLHMKLIITDDIVYVGSANFDMRSLYLNAENVLRIENAALAETMRDFFQLHIANCQLIDPIAHRLHSTPFARIRWLIGYLLVAVVDYGIARRLNWKAR